MVSLLQLRVLQEFLHPQWHIFSILAWLVVSRCLNTLQKISYVKQPSLCLIWPHVETIIPLSIPFRVQRAKTLVGQPIIDIAYGTTRKMEVVGIEFHEVLEFWDF